MAKIPLSLLFATTLLPATANYSPTHDLDQFKLVSSVMLRAVSGYFFPATNGQAYLYDGTYHNLGTLALDHAQHLYQRHKSQLRRRYVP